MTMPHSIDPYLFMRRRCSFFYGSLICVTRLAIAGGGADLVGLLLIQPLENCKGVACLLDFSPPLISLCEVGVNGWRPGLKPACLFQMRDCVLKVASYQIEVAKRNLRSRIVWLLHDRLFQNGLRFYEVRLTGAGSRAN